MCQNLPLGQIVGSEAEVRPRDIDELVEIQLNEAGTRHKSA